ncbi:BTB/POZ domain-containing protein At1g55760-like [Impatiens glandulifera]|uniref:BTB/POZ domain-containing protein At1g55760-like n=1 Tax=Impatiens glandulifera TaxID=253017 RepID=UPI001FB19F38|nr:BTB/POZ domain-containing protein At1g55760-like [Impatiens glandulifera]
MTDSGYQVKTTSRLAQWSIDNLLPSTYRKSDPFMIGNWNWYLSVEKKRTIFIKLYPETSNLTKDSPPIASFIIRIISFAGDRRSLAHPEVTDRKLKNIGDFVWVIELPLTSKFIIDLEFLDLKISSPVSNENEPFSIWADGLRQKQSNKFALTSLGRMLSENIQSDVEIRVSNGILQAHRAVLASRSPFFNKLFLKEINQSSTINIPNVSIESFRVFLNYIYGNIQSDQEFKTNRLSLLAAAQMFEVEDLKDACHESLMEDIDANNVLERLENASLYGLSELKCSCLQYLVKFGKIFDIRDEFNDFLQSGNRELIMEIFDSVLVAWNGF